MLRRWGSVAALMAFLALRYFQAEASFQKEAALFPRPEKGRFRLWVAEEPQVFFEHEVGSHETGRSGDLYQPFVREVRAVCVLTAWNGREMPPVQVRCSLFLKGEAPVLSYGDGLEVQAKIQRPSSAMNPGQFDYAHFLQAQGVAFTLYATPGHWSRAGEGGGWFLPRWSWALKRWAEGTLYRDLPFPENALLDGILLGERSPIPEEVVRSFFLTGTIHILAVSGLMTAFLASLVFMVLRVCQVRRRWAAALTLPVLLFFVLMTGAHPPVCRAGLFSALALVGILLDRRVHGGVLLMATAFFLLAVNPFLITDLSFQISFLATAGLMVLSPWMMEKLSFLWRPAAFLVTATAAAQAAVWVLLIHSFNQASLYSLPANLLIVPLALFATAGGVTLLAGSFLHPALGSLFGAACEVPLKLLVLLADAMAGLPGVEWVLASPPGAWVLLYHLLLLASFFLFWPRSRPESPSAGWKAREASLTKGRRWLKRAWAVYGLAALVAGTWALFQSRPLRVAFLSVGHGNAAVLRGPDGRVLVIDGGKGTRGADRYHVLSCYLRHEGIRRVEAALLTHTDEDHVGGLVNLLGAYPVGKVHEGAGSSADSSVYRAFEERIASRVIPKDLLAQGDRLEDLPGVEVRILHPDPKYRPRLHEDNNRSLVTLVSYGGVQFLFPGDLEKDGLERLLRDNRPFPRVDWLLAPHHGRRSGEPELCAREIKPRFSVLSDWRDYPDDHDFFRLTDPQAQVLATAAEGAVEVEVDAQGRGRWRSFREGKWHTFEKSP